MTKGELIAALADNCGCSKQKAGDMVNGLIDVITGALKGGQKVTITGFGTFSVRHRKARTGVNPQNPSQKIQIPARNTVGFTAGKMLKESVR